MNKIMIIIISCGIIAAFIFTFTFGYSIGKVRTNVPDTVVIKVKEGNDSVKWDKLINAIIQVESERKDSAKSNKGAVGQLQLMPVYVKDANRILGEEKYSLSDRYKRDTSIEMFNVIQDHYNPTHDIAKAIKLHNPKAGKWYYNRVMEQLKNQEI